MASISNYKTDLSNVSVALAKQFGANDVVLVGLIATVLGSQTRSYIGVAEDLTTGTASYVPFVATASAIAPGYSQSTLVTPHTDKAAPALADAITAAVALIGTAPSAEAAPPAGAEEPALEQAPQTAAEEPAAEEPAVGQ